MFNNYKSKRNRKLHLSRFLLPDLKVFFFVGVFALGWAPARGEETWLVFQPPASVTFSVSTPGKPQKMGGRDEWRARDTAGREYSAGFGYYTEPKRIDDPESFMRMMVNRLAANSKSKVAYCWFFKYQDVPACEFKLVDGEHHQMAVGRYFLVNQWFYFLDYTASDKIFEVKPMKKFFESFQIINPALKDFQPGSEKGF